MLVADANRFTKLAINSSSGTSRTLVTGASGQKIFVWRCLLTTAGATGTIIPWVSKLSGLALTSAAGVVTISIGDSGTPTFYFNLVMPNGKRVRSAAITFA